MDKPVLVVMAAGLGSRYGGLKQMDAVSEQGDWIIDFSLHDAYSAGFRDVVFIVREEIEKDFKETIGKRIAGKLNDQYAVQSLEDIPKDCVIPVGRVKPWGTGHAVYSARKQIGKRPFMVINADDFYGPDAFKEIFGAISNENAPSDEYYMVSYNLKNTVTANGHVARGICKVNEAGFLVEVVERTNIQVFGEQIKYTTSEGEDWVELCPETPVSLNCWGFKANILEEMENELPAFFSGSVKENPEKAEYFLPWVVEQMIEKGSAKVKVLGSKDKWYGVTYREDREEIGAAIKQFKGKGQYPASLWV